MPSCQGECSYPKVLKRIYWYTLLNFSIPKWYLNAGTLPKDKIWTQNYGWIIEYDQPSNWLTYEKHLGPPTSMQDWGILPILNVPMQLKNFAGMHGPRFLGFLDVFGLNLQNAFHYLEKRHFCSYPGYWYVPFWFFLAFWGVWKSARGLSADLEKHREIRLRDAWRVRTNETSQKKRGVLCN